MIFDCRDIYLGRFQSNRLRAVERILFIHLDAIEKVNAMMNVLALPM